MHTEPCTASGGVYHPRNPRASPLHQCVRRHYDELEAGGHFTRPVEEQALTRFLDCGDLHQGFARLYCHDCGQDYLLAFSCKARYFCPSCHQKRMLAYGEWVEEHILAPVPHRQYVFALPKLLRPYIPQHRERLGTLCQIIAQLLFQGFRAMAPEGRPGFILYVQTFGDLVIFVNRNLKCPLFRKLICPLVDKIIMSLNLVDIRQLPLCGPFSLVVQTDRPCVSLSSGNSRL